MPIDAAKYDRTLVLRCPTCAGTEFIGADIQEDSQAPLICNNCKLSISRQDLHRANEENIEAHLEELKTGVLSDVQEELSKSLKRGFSGFKNIKIQ